MCYLLEDVYLIKWKQKDFLDKNSQVKQILRDIICNGWVIDKCYSETTTKEALFIELWYRLLITVKCKTPPCFSDNLQIEFKYTKIDLAAPYILIYTFLHVAKQLSEVHLLKWINIPNIDLCFWIRIHLSSTTKTSSKNEIPNVDLHLYNKILFVDTLPWIH